MAKYEDRLTGNPHEFVAFIDKEILQGSMSASYEDGSDLPLANLYCAVRVYERYSMLGGNRVSLNLTVAGGEEGKFFVSAITSGGSQALLMKINTVGEKRFLELFISAVQKYKTGGR